MCVCKCMFVKHTKVFGGDSHLIRFTYEGKGSCTSQYSPLHFFLLTLEAACMSALIVYMCLLVAMLEIICAGKAATFLLHSNR